MRFMKQGFMGGLARCTETIGTDLILLRCTSVLLNGVMDLINSS